MRETKKIIQEVNYTCDFCQKTSTDFKWWIWFQEIRDNCLRVYQRIENPETRHLRIWLRNLDFCSIDCSCWYLKESVERFSFEINSYKEEKPMVKLA